MLSSLEKVLPCERVVRERDYDCTAALLGERVSFQININSGKPWYRNTVKVSLSGELAACTTIRLVKSVPADMPVYRDEHDDDIITDRPTLIPDVLVPFEPGASLDAVYEQNRTLWFTIESGEETAAGKRELKVIFESGEGRVEKVFSVEYINARLPKQQLRVTQWFHTDCIMTYYGLEAFSDEHFRRIRDFVKTAVKNGINMILTPIVTPPLDTEVGGERPTVQLVDMKYIGGSWSFGFEKLDRFIDICLECGVEYFEMAHLFTQWGAHFTPKIVAQTEDGIKRIFGWDVASDSEEYAKFIGAFLPELTAYLKNKGIAGHTIFHVSDEPTAENIGSYKYCRALIEKYLDGFVIADALCDYRFYESGAVTKPIVATDHVSPFIEHKVRGLWVYYCCAQKLGVSNRFMAMPSRRNRVIAAQFFKYDIEGFLQWGYNFYYSQYSKRPLDPFTETSADAAFPSGDSFSVYPAPDGVYESLRLVVFHEALQDLSAFRLLESYIGHDAVVKLIEDTAGMTVEFDKYPRSDEFILKLRARVNEEIKKRL